MFRLLALLQLTRAALAFTAIADAWTILLLRAQPHDGPGEAMWVMIVKMIILSVVSAGLYGFGMSLNDALDARRDRIFAPRRPIPSGRIAPRTAIVVALFLLLVALLAAAVLGAVNQSLVPWPFFFAFASACLIVFYDGISKYLGSIGILTLAGIRSLHCLIGNPTTPFLFLSMILLTHIFLVSLLAYKWENKRPRLTWLNVVVGVAGCVLGNGLALGYMYFRGVFEKPIVPMLVGPAVALGVFGVWTLWLMGRKRLSSRQKGERLMLLGLFWLFVYDASMLLSNGQYLAALSVALLLLCAMGSFFGIRSLARSLAQPRVQYRLERANGK